MDSQTKDSASFVFKGTVRRVKAANVKAVTDTKRTIVVRVDEIVRAPEALADHLGEDITLLLAKGERASKGQRGVFYTNGWIFGERLAVQSLGHEPIAMASRALTASAVEQVDPVSADKHHQIRRHARGAKLIISGRVVAVGEAEPPPGESDEFQPLSEHDPVWNEAVIDVDEVHKGRTKKKRVVVRFPASEDAHWVHTPKFQVGHDGVFILHVDQVSEPESLGMVATALDSKESYTCLSPVGFQPSDHFEECETAVQAAKE